MPEITISRSIGTICLCVFLVLTGLAMLAHVAIPAWFIGLLAIAAGLFLLLGI